MMRQLCRAKIHRAVVTQTDMDYAGSITIAKDLLHAAGIAEYERVLVANLNNGMRCETYAISGLAGSGEVCMNGAAARWAVPGDRVIVMAFGLAEESEIDGFKPVVIVLDENNRIAETL